ALARLGKSGLRQAERRQEELRERLSGLAPRQLAAARRERRRLGERVAGAARGHLREAQATVQGIERLCHQIAPERTLERGFSLTLDPAGKSVRHPDQVRSGDLITTRVAGGSFESRVETK
ncbi:MAG TPA: exodeoxyribonuclease VII large subunit, partial [Thermoanaerobaculia bacterium]|nr:exodeoxyribonuclease VII large subunit [Thermoanaerobaculia bacterium]